MITPMQEYIDRLMNPPIVLGRGYFILDMRPGAINRFRPLGRNERPLKILAAFERSLS